MVTMMEGVDGHGSTGCSVSARKQERRMFDRAPFPLSGLQHPGSCTPHCPPLPFDVETHSIVVRHTERMPDCTVAHEMPAPPRPFPFQDMTDGTVFARPRTPKSQRESAAHVCSSTRQTWQREGRPAAHGTHLGPKCYAAAGPHDCTRGKPASRFRVHVPTHPAVSGAGFCGHWTSHECSCVGSRSG